MKRSSVSLWEVFFFFSLNACVLLREGLRLVNVQGGSTYPPLLQRLGQGLLVHQASPRGVDQKRTLTHLWCTRHINPNKSTRNNQRYSQLFTDKWAHVSVFFCASVSLAVKLICLILSGTSIWIWMSAFEGLKRYYTRQILRSGKKEIGWHLLFCLTPERFRKQTAPWKKILSDVG